MDVSKFIFKLISSRRDVQTGVIVSRWDIQTAGISTTDVNVYEVAGDGGDRETQYETHYRSDIFLHFSHNLPIKQIWKKFNSLIIKKKLDLYKKCLY